MSLVAELARRNVIRMAGLYLVGAWLVTQVAGTVLPMFGAPAWLPRGAQGGELVAALTGNSDAAALAARYAALSYNSRFDPRSGNAIEGYDLPSVLMLLGEPALALDFVEKLAASPGGTADWTVMMPAMDPIRCEPRFVAVVSKLKTADPHFERVCAGKP